MTPFTLAARPFWFSLLVSNLLFARLGWAQQTPRHGLRATYYTGQNFAHPVRTTIDPVLDFNWQEQEPLPGVPATNFSVRWTGLVQAPVTGRYTFRTIADDGLRVWLDGQLMVDDWQNHGTTLHTAARTLQAGTYHTLQVDYYQNSLRSRAYLGWDIPGERWNFTPQLLALYGPSAPLSPIPSRYLTAVDLPVHLPLVKAPAVAVTPPKQPTYRTVAAGNRRQGGPTVAPRKARKYLRPVHVAKKAVVPLPLSPSITKQESTTLTTGQSLALHRLFFQQSSPQLLVSSQPELNWLVQLLRQQPTLRLEIAGHTDNVGDSLLNRRLSYRRAAVVRTYLVQQALIQLGFKQWGMVVPAR